MPSFPPEAVRVHSLHIQYFIQYWTDDPANRYCQDPELSYPQEIDHCDPSRVVLLEQMSGFQLMQAACIVFELGGRRYECVTDTTFENDHVYPTCWYFPGGKIVPPSKVSKQLRALFPPADGEYFIRTRHGHCYRFRSGADTPEGAKVL